MKIHIVFNRAALILILALPANNATSQNRTETSLFLKKDSTKYLEEVRSETGDMYTIVGHHGPAIENEWLGLRFFFNSSTAIDVYSKQQQRLELKAARWYPTAEQQMEGWGADMYKVGTTVGLGGIRLWDGEKVVLLDPVEERIARVGKEGCISWMDLVSRGVPYKDTKVDIMVRVTVYSGTREAKVEAFALTDEPVQFVTGINYHEGNTVTKNKGHIAVWGVHPEDVAAEPVDLGAAVMYNPDSFVDKLNDGSQVLLVSEPLKYLKIRITSASSNDPDINTRTKFEDYVRSR